MSALDNTTEALALLERAVATRGPEYVYEGKDPASRCLYTWPDGTPGCLIGVWMDLAGISRPPYIDGQYFDDDNDDNCKSVNVLTCGLSADVREVLHEAQALQDHRRTWGAALAVARRAAAELAGTE